MNTCNIELTIDLVAGETLTETIDLVDQSEINNIPDLEAFINTLTEGKEVNFWEITDYDNAPDKYSDHNSIFTWVEALRVSDLETPIIEAALECEISPDNIEEAYTGQYDSDEDFAENLADNLGLIENMAQWPYNCIDWEHAAKELMYDYTAYNGYYFRVL